MFSTAAIFATRSRLDLNRYKGTTVLSRPGTFEFGCLSKFQPGVRVIRPQLCLENYGNFIGMEFGFGKEEISFLQTITEALNGPVCKIFS